MHSLGQKKLTNTKVCVVEFCKDVLESACIVFSTVDSLNAPTVQYCSVCYALCLIEENMAVIDET